MKIELENSIRRLSFLCRLLDIKIAWIYRNIKTQGITTGETSFIKRNGFY